MRRNRISKEQFDTVDRVRYAEVFGTEAGLAGANFNPTKFDPLLFHLPKVVWVVFGTLTWRLGSRRYDSKRAAWFRSHDFDGVLFRTCSILRLRVKNLGIYWTTEFGVFGEAHIHFLVAREGLKGVTPEKFVEEFGRLWRDEFRPAGDLDNGVGLAEVKPYEEAKGSSGVAYCLKREFDEVGRNRERYDFLSPKLKKIIRAVSDQPIVTGLPSAHMEACSGVGRFFGQKFSGFQNARQDGPDHGARPILEVNPQPVDPVFRVEPVTSEQAGLNMVVETPLSVKLGALRN